MSRPGETRRLPARAAVAQYVDFLNRYGFDPETMALSVSSPITAGVGFVKNKFVVGDVPVNNIPTEDLRAIRETMPRRLASRPLSTADALTKAKFFFVWNSAQVYKRLLLIPESYKPLVGSGLTRLVRMEDDGRIDVDHDESRKWRVEFATKVYGTLHRLSHHYRQTGIVERSFNVHRYYAELVKHGTDLYEEMWTTATEPLYLRGPVLNGRLLDRVHGVEVDIYRPATTREVQAALLDLRELRGFLAKGKNTSGRSVDSYALFTFHFAGEQIERFEGLDRGCGTAVVSPQSEDNLANANECILSLLDEFRTRVANSRHDIPKMKRCVSKIVNSYLLDRSSAAVVVEDGHLQYLEEVFRRLAPVPVWTPAQSGRERITALAYPEKVSDDLRCPA